MSKKTRKKSSKAPPGKSGRTSAAKPSAAKTARGSKASAKKPAAKGRQDGGKAAAKGAGKKPAQAPKAASAKASHKAPSKSLKSNPSAPPRSSPEPLPQPPRQSPPVPETGAAEVAVEGAMAPAFQLPRDGGGSVSLADYAGKKLVLFFYPRADTPGCTREAIDFTRLSDAFADEGAAVLGISADSVKAQESFRDKHQLSVPLISDETA